MTGQSASELLASAIYQDEVIGNLDLAAETYQRIVQEYPNERSIAAESLFRLGLVNEKWGNQKAKSNYQQIIDHYTDQLVFVERARNRLQKLSNGALIDGKGVVNTTNKSTSTMLSAKQVEWPAYTFSVSPDDQYLSYTAFNGNLAIYDQETKEHHILTPDSPKFNSDSIGDGGRSMFSAWSPDSKKIAYNWSIEKSGIDLRIYDLEMGQFNIIYAYQNAVYPYLSEWSKDGKHLLVLLWNKKTDVQEIALINVEDHRVNIIKKMPENEHRRSYARTSLSPNGRYILYDDHNENKEIELFIHDIETGVSRFLYGDLKSSQKNPFWLNDNRNFMFFSIRSGVPALWKATLDDEMKVQNTKLLANGLGSFYHHVGLTRDNTYYYWSHIRMRSVYANTIDHDTYRLVDEKLVPSGLEGQKFRPIYSHDGNKVAWLEVNRSPRVFEVTDLKTGNVAEYDFDLGPQRTILWGPPSWTADDQKIVFRIRNAKKRSGESHSNSAVNEIVIGDIRTNRSQLLVSNGSQPQIGPAGHIYFLRENAIWQYDPITSQESKVFASDKTRLHYISLSPDGKYMGLFVGPINTYQKSKELQLLSLSDLSLRSLWKCEEKDRFFWALCWFSDSNRFIVDHINGNDQTQQLYIYNINSNTRKRLGTSVGQDDYMLDISIHPDDTQNFIYKGK